MERQLESVANKKNLEQSARDQFLKRVAILNIYKIPHFLISFIKNEFIVFKIENPRIHFKQNF